MHAIHNKLWDCFVLSNTSAGELKVLFFNWKWWEHAQHHPMGLQSLASNTLKGQGQQGQQCLLTRFHRSPQMSHCHSFCLSWPTSVGLHLWSYFGLTFRVSLRFISLFSSISSCSLRAAENEFKSYTHTNTELSTKCLEITERGTNTICIIWLIRFTLNWISFSKLKIVFIIGCLILLGMSIRGESFVSFKLSQGFLFHVYDVINLFRNKSSFFQTMKCWLHLGSHLSKIHVASQLQRQNSPAQRSKLKSGD